MAEASQRSGRFFCHRCSTEISPRLPDYTCPICESGFIEELSEERRYRGFSHENKSRFLCVEVYVAFLSVQCVRAVQKMALHPRLPPGTRTTRSSR
ncbi:unnamed protein product [Tetraodon nigroviridis]|uniref:RING-type E3 ubiquitin transferase n=1 Tax=Tetraodon nigroviridis TaxID=99883 RepID=Q4RV54_TETNG|nr:unnamed protein product [Tetraodon nigroviridis]